MVGLPIYIQKMLYPITYKGFDFIPITYNYIYNFSNNFLM